MPANGTFSGSSAGKDIAMDMCYLLVDNCRVAAIGHRRKTGPTILRSGEPEMKFDIPTRR
ncbi:hypothetical protein MIPYR_100032 [uncultured Microbacterium sp.]|uniref:Uncharacterized protein n=1 Tax=uncultured Microbacterium sp. TaxID=191216 RepID=A0A1Y5NXS5_9MICO|nr:hypothetical protein MIPYR_100032 [uncultured Microbacterium sp.]